MTHKYMLVISLLLASFTLLAETYNLTGVVVEQSADASIINIDNIDYAIDYETRLHNSLQMPGELAPKFESGDTIGFNIEQEADKLPKITDIWVLDN